jgi:hypothetical protein
LYGVGDETNEHDEVRWIHLGNHDFDNGIEGLTKQLTMQLSLCKLIMIFLSYLKGKIDPYKIFIKTDYHRCVWFGN